MKRVEAIIEPGDLEVLKDRLLAIGVEGMTVVPARGLQSSGRTEVYRGAAYATSFADRVRVQLIVTDHAADKIVDALLIVSRAGKIGDGRIFVEPIEEAVRIGTGERGEDAL